MKTLRIVLVNLCLLGFAGCKYLENDATAVADAKGDISATSTFGSGPEQVWVDKAKTHFRNGEYGLAERYYRQAIEERRAMSRRGSALPRHTIILRGSTRRTAPTRS